MALQKLYVWCKSDWADIRLRDATINLSRGISIENFTTQSSGQFFRPRYLEKLSVDGSRIYIETNHPATYEPHFRITFYVDTAVTRLKADIRKGDFKWAGIYSFNSNVSKRNTKSGEPDRNHELIELPLTRGEREKMEDELEKLATSGEPLTEDHDKSLGMPGDDYPTT